MKEFNKTLALVPDPDTEVPVNVPALKSVSVVCVVERVPVASVMPPAPALTLLSAEYCVELAVGDASVLAVDRPPNSSAQKYMSAHSRSRAPKRIG